MNTPDKIFVKALNPDAIVINPETRLSLKTEGEWVTKTKYWLRRIADETVEITEPKTSKK